MEQTAHNENAQTRRKSFILAIITSLILLYAAVPTYGIIQDLSAGEHVFVLSSGFTGVTMKRPVLEFIDRSHRPFSPQQDVAVPVGQRINLKGRVAYTDGTPYPNGLIELRSSPRYTRTDGQGYFMFSPPESPDTYPAPPPGGNGDSSEGVNPSPFGFDVLDDATTTSYVTAGAISINIFGVNKRIAPGMSGTYKFTVDNTGNQYSTFYDVSFTATDTLPDACKIPMRFRLKADGRYVAGNATAWCTPAQLYQNTIVAGGRDVEYTLEWNWPEGANDSDYAAYAGNAAYSYSIAIRVTAQAQ